MIRITFACIVLFLASAIPLYAAGKPVVLFQARVHHSYVAQPLVAMGIEVDAAPAGKLAEMLATGQYNVAVVGTMNDAERKAIEAFLAKGGGVFMCMPEHAYKEASSWATSDWTTTNQWLEKLGARPRWEVLLDSDKNNIHRDEMSMPLSWSTDVAAPVNEGVRGVLILTSHTGKSSIEPPMSFDLSKDWQVVVRGAATLKGVKEVRQDPVLQNWIPKEPVAGSPPLMAIRQVGAGRMVILGIRKYWIFSPPPNCPTTEAMLTTGVGNQPSDWLKVCANTFRWLAEPAQKAGLGGATTPETVLHPTVIWPKAPRIDWSQESTVSQLPDQLQIRGLVGARTALSTGTGTVADYVRAAREAGLQFLVFMEDGLKLDEAKWAQLVEQCKANSDDVFLAVPGLTYEDAQGNHLYAFADTVKMLKPEMLLPDGRLATLQTMRSRGYFNFNQQYLRQAVLSGFWNHRANMLHFADYKLYNSFPIYSFENGRQIDNALGEFLYLNSIGGCQAPVAFEFMTEPAQVAKRAAEGWKIVSHRGLQDLNGNWNKGAWSFSGSGSQYISNGPQILVWQSPNRMAQPRGEWWRPDIWQYRLQFRVASEHGLKSVTLLDGDRQVLRRYQPNGAKVFEQELVLANSQQISPLLVVEDLQGRRAISAAFWMRNLNNHQAICTDRCNLLGDARLRTRNGEQVWTYAGFSASTNIIPNKGQLTMGVAPAFLLTPNAPTLPIDGTPVGFPTLSMNFYPRIPGELPYLFSFPRQYLIGAEIGIGQADITLAYDPLEEGAKYTPLGHLYEDSSKQYGWGNAWGSWHRLVPTMKVEGWQRIYAHTWLTEGFRLGAVETNLTVKNSIDVPAEGLYVTQAKGELWQNGKKIGDASTERLTGAFDRGVFCTYEDNGGAVVLIGTGDGLTYDYAKGTIKLFYRPKTDLLMPGDCIRHIVYFAGASGGTPQQRTTTAQMVEFARQFGILEPGKAGYAPKMLAGKTLDTYMLWNVDAQGTAVQAQIPKTAMPGFLPAAVDGLNDHWSVYLLDNAQKGDNFRMLPIRDGRAWAQLDLNLADSDLFLGHPVTASDPKVTLLVSWKQEGQWVIEAHNPTDAPITAALTTTKGWPKFDFTEKIELAPGSSKTWAVAERK